MVGRALTLLVVVLSAPVSLRAQAGEHDTQVRGYWVDPSTGLMWAARDNVRGDLNWGQAIKYCGDLKLAGYTDWRLPTIGELEGIYDRSANALGLAGKHNENSATWHIKGGLFLTGAAWSASRRNDDRGRPGGFALLFDFSKGSRDLYELWVGRRALCIRGDVTIDLSLPGLSRVDAARQLGVDYTARRYFAVNSRATQLSYWQARIGCEDGVVTRVAWLGAERNCRRWLELTDHVVGDATLDRVYALELLGLSVASEHRLVESLAWLDRALVMRRRRYEDDGDAADVLAIAAQIQIALGNAAAADALLDSAIATYEREVARPSRFQELYRWRLAAIRKQLRR